MSVGVEDAILEKCISAGTSDTLRFELTWIGSDNKRLKLNKDKNQ